VVYNFETRELKYVVWKFHQERLTAFLIVLQSFYFLNILKLQWENDFIMKQKKTGCALSVKWMKNLNFLNLGPRIFRLGNFDHEVDKIKKLLLFEKLFLGWRLEIQNSSNPLPFGSGPFLLLNVTIPVQNGTGRVRASCQHACFI